MRINSTTLLTIIFVFFGILNAREKYQTYPLWDISLSIVGGNAFASDFSENKYNMSKSDLTSRASSSVSLGRNLDEFSPISILAMVNYGLIGNGKINRRIGYNFDTTTNTEYLSYLLGVKYQNLHKYASFEISLATGPVFVKSKSRINNVTCNDIQEYWYGTNPNNLEKHFYCGDSLPPYLISKNDDEYSKWAWIVRPQVRFMPNWFVSLDVFFQYKKHGVTGFGTGLSFHI